MAKTMPIEYYQQLEEIQTADFVLVELVLYLDTHPTDAQAIEQYNQYAQYSKQLKRTFESQFGPLELGSINQIPDYWQWNRSPWPWEV
ncbi:spore coat protein CotJB [Domibacillus epiphyticus]|uniref:Spore coat protein CotJB n=1 Tax=Domibacillus epiphyticus TaxID=1714355 RepID=A0A1V2A8L6_9BACI|nr:spore coat protein CotJB [Domibacillus epiphyticus]OMP67202.1 spore coat protein CotJB [Domibacillus epiphyticus]